MIPPPTIRARWLEDEIWAAQARNLARDKAAAILWVRRGRCLLARRGSVSEVLAETPRRVAEGLVAYVAAREPRDEIKMERWLTQLGARVVIGRVLEHATRIES